MNQNRNFAERTETSLFMRSINILLTFSILILFSTVTSTDAAAQANSFRPQNNSNIGQWSPPVSRTPGVARASYEQAPPSLPEGFSFPKADAEFDPIGRTAEHPFPTPETPGDSTAVDATIKSTAGMIANLKNATSEKLSGLAATLEQDGNWMQKAQSMFGSTDISRMLGSLTLVLGIYFAFVWVMRKINPGANAGLPAEIIEVMGQVPFGPKRNLQLVRLGSKLLLLMNSPEGTQPIGEITDPVEVEYLTSICPGKRKAGSRSLAAIQSAAGRIANARQEPTSAPVPATGPTSAAGHATHNSLANILRTLDQVKSQNNAIFEA